VTVTLPPLPDPATVTVVIPARHAGGTVAEAVRSALTQEPPVTEVVVACDPADDATRSALAPLLSPGGRVRTVDVPGGRTPDALQTGIDASFGDVVVRLDAHAELPAGYVARAVGTLRRTGAGNVGGRQVPAASRGFAVAVAAAMASPFGAGGATYRTGEAAGPADTVYLGVFRRAALDAVGGFDRRMTRNQDAELNLRLRRAGYEVWFDPELAVSYVPRGRVTDLARQYWGYGRWRRVTAGLHPGSLALRQLAAPALVGGLAAAAALAVLTGWWWVITVPAGGYLTGLLAAGIAASGRIAGGLATAVALGTMHLAWGLGFLAGPPRGAVQTSRAGDQP
jgi:succinoglycan biosynthesis protein ExoA